MHPPSRPRQALATVTALAFAAVVHAQDRPKPPPTPPAIVDVDLKIQDQGRPTPTRPKVAERRQERDSVPEPGKDLGVTLPNGTRVRGLLATGVVSFGSAPGTLCANADSYKAEFHAVGVTFVPFFGARAPVSYPLTISVTEIGEVAVTAQPTPERIGTTVAYHRGAVRELYRLSPGQMEQVFEIDRWAGSELEIGMAVQSQMSATTTAEGIRFTSPYGSVLYGNAVLIDANGHRHAMRTRLDGDRIRLSAPVAGVPFPVVVDPVVRAFTLTSQTATAQANADIAYGATQREYLVVFERVVSGTDSDVYSVAVDATGNPVANSGAWIDVSSDSWRVPRVAYNLLADRFLVVAARTPAGGGASAIWSRTRDARTPVLGNVTQVSGTESGDKLWPDVGGDFYAVPATYFAVVWQRNYTGTDTDIHYRLVQGDGAPVGTTVQWIDNSSATDLRPRIAKSNGAGPSFEQVWPVVWHRDVGNHDDIYGARLTWDGVVATPSFVIDAAADTDRYASVSSPAETYAGARHWLVAYQTDARGDLDVYYRTYRDASPPVADFSGYLGDLEGLDPPTRMRHQLLPQVDSDGCRFAIAYVEEFSLTDWDAWVTTVHRASGLGTTEARLALDRSSLFSGSVGVTAAHSGGGAVADYGVIWNSDAASGPPLSEIRGAVFQGITPSGGYVVRATRCAGLTLAHDGTPPAIGAALTFTVGGTSAPRFIVLSVPATAVSICAEGCRLGVDPSLMILFGQSALSVRVPCDGILVGSIVAFQGGAVGVSGGCAIFNNLALTDTIDVTIR